MSSPEPVATREGERGWAVMAKREEVWASKWAMESFWRSMVRASGSESLSEGSESMGWSVSGGISSSASAASRRASSSSEGMSGVGESVGGIVMFLDSWEVFWRLLAMQ